MPRPQEASFRGERAFLSNFYPCTVKIPSLDGEYANDLECVTVEHAFAASKTLDPQWRRRIAFTDTPGNAKRIGRQAPLRHDWDAVRVSVMLDLLRQKFRDPRLAKMLKATGTGILVEGNWWHDQFWGQCTCPRHAQEHGKNTLGTLLMQVREEIQ